MESKEILRSLLLAGDRRSVGRADEVADLVRLHPKQARKLVKCLWDGDACVRMRAADALEKISRQHAMLLQRYKKKLLGLLVETEQKEVRWHLAVTIPRLQLTVSECQRAAETLQSYLEDRSSIVKTLAMQGLWDLTSQAVDLRPKVLELIRAMTRTGTPAMRARGRALLQYRVDN